MKETVSKFIKFLNLPFSRKIQVLSFFYRLVFCSVIYRLLCKKFGRRSIVKKPLIITYEDISFGDDVIIWEDARIESVRSYFESSFQPHIKISNGVSFQQRCHITAAGELIIGENSIISYDVMITDIDHEYVDVLTPIGKQPLKVSPTIIGEQCFIGCGVKIQAGTQLGKHCIVGANSVVRGIFPDYSVIVGSPAKIVKTYDKKSNTWIRC
ncbi:O-acetyltransferase [Aliivibrio fischeri ES114]|uniref:O-acetyltransferase n=1 Tax=Aliivibrio fischeri (strain ATCC 700601 / ES114) TaxID=312309 RepID=Q5E8H9_ALIF1|nr:acyltransferase [Aliivibrio fischeri]AAW84667.1 O-acetyltransferase [Aliivibrio fischeri ES114]